ncbi:MAG: monovalent cation/H+ antiporter subunit D family protein [Pirellulaceae bacterium]|nr:monovalent cation/H+ antiporter subunit D family protein [Pirellulaceae bacterium]
MSWSQCLPLLVVASSLLPGIVIFFLPEERRSWRTTLNLSGALGKIVLVALMLWGVFQGERFVVRYSLLPNVEFRLHADPLSLLFVTLSATLWLLTTIYAIGYLEGSPNRSRFFGFFSLCVAATTGIAVAGNLLTFLIFYELLTLATYPLVVHRGTTQSLSAGRIYLAYTLAGSAALLLGVVWLSSFVGTPEFIEGGYLDEVDPRHQGSLVRIFALMILGVGVKAAIVPLHGWLPSAMVAPAPVSALLHAVAVVKAGAFGVVRIVYDVFGVEFCSTLGVTEPLAMAAAVTIVYGSIRALYQDDLKRRLAFSTVSQVSYIILGTAVLGPLATLGGIVHLVHQGVMKITLFFCAGNLAEALGVHRVSELNGVGRRMPWTMAAFTVGALGMIGVPPTAGFISKWYLAMGASAAEEPWYILVLVVSSVLNACYFLPIVYAAWFKQPAGPWPVDQRAGRLETKLSLLVPTIATALLVVGFGLLASVWFSPLGWASLIVEREYQR